jgi:23S rRNA pseudouridine1911/1915/1917 synthase
MHNKSGWLRPFTAELVVERYLSGVRIDSFLARHFRNYTSFRMQRLVQCGYARINDVAVDIDQRVFRGQRVSVRLCEPPDKLLPPEPLPLEILYEDPWLVVVNKPAGLVTHPVPAFQRRTLANALQWHLDQQTVLPGLLRPGIVHRLDRQTSGVIAVTKEHLSHRLLSIEFQRSRVSKAYLALVEGAMAKNSGAVDLPIGRAAGHRCALMSARADAREAKPSRTLYEIVERFDAHTLVRAKPLTGRNHQIRVHLATIGHPVVGDEFYGRYGVLKSNADGNAPGGDNNLAGRHALHAERLGFSHPILREWMDLHAPLPPDMQRAIALAAESRLQPAG